MATALGPRRLLYPVTMKLTGLSQDKRSQVYAGLRRMLASGDFVILFVMTVSIYSLLYIAEIVDLNPPLALREFTE